PARRVRVAGLGLRGCLAVPADVRGHRRGRRSLAPRRQARDIVLVQRLRGVDAEEEPERIGREQSSLAPLSVALSYVMAKRSDADRGPENGYGLTARAGSSRRRGRRRKGEDRP